MPLTLDVTDSATDPTGATATVAGSGGAAVAVYAQPVDGLVGAGTWQTVGGRTGDGAVSLALAKGFWWVYARAGSDLSGLSYLHVTDGQDAPGTRCRRAVAARILLLAIPEFAGRVYEQIDPDGLNLVFPCVILSVAGEAETDARGLNAADDKGYPVRVTIAVKQQGGAAPDHAKLPLYERWRYLIERAFDQQHLPGVDESVVCRVEPLAIADPELPAYQHLVSGLLVRCVCRVPRGLGV